MKQHDEQTMKSLEEWRQKVIARQKMMQDLERETMSANKSTKPMGYEEHLRDMEVYGLPTSGLTPMSTTPTTLSQLPSSSKQVTTMWGETGTVSSLPFFTPSQDHGRQ